MNLPNDPQTAIRVLAERAEPHVIALRRDIHAHPELGFQEVRTSRVVADELARLGIPHQTGVGRTGVVGLIEGARPGPVVAIRADMDALPIEERTGLEFESTNRGLMHACGHDVHTATLLGVASVLKELAPQLSGTVKLVFQPAEEGLGGMAAMIDDGVLESPRVDYALGFHNYPDMPVGTFGYVRGASCAAADRFDIVVHGRSGHAAHPEQAIDPIVAAAMLVGQLQTVVSRELPPMSPVVVTVGAINGGQTHNIIPDSCTLRGTIRTLRPETREAVEAAVRRHCSALEQSQRVRCEVHLRRGVPPLMNDLSLVDRCSVSVARQFDDGAIAEGAPSLGGEDFALMANRVPAFHLRVGSGAPGRTDKLHNSEYQPDERCIGLGVQALARTAFDLLAAA
ncbi:MAG TPA: M20 family metallopeptidase [Acidisphaera sp.]|nr:M20 family metallopeptidase [Acidisphaera sp.]